VRDDARKIHPLIVGWEQLDETERDKDREPVREIPEMLARAGFEIIRIGAFSGASALRSVDEPALEGALDGGVQGVQPVERQGLR
jgi:hypothetical protein